jgi:hypothetical protein
MRALLKQVFFISQVTDSHFVRDVYGMDAEYGRCVGPDKLKPFDLRFS